MKACFQQQMFCSREESTYYLELLDDLDLPLKEAMTSWVVRTACSHGEFLLVNKFLVLLAGKLGTVVTDNFLWSAKH